MGYYNSITNRIDRIDSFSRSSILIFAGSFVISLLSFLYYPALARLLDVKEFGEVQILVTLFTQTSMVLTAITSISVILVAKAVEAKKDVSFVKELQKLVSYTFIIFALVIIIFHQVVLDYLQLTSIFSLISLLVGLGINIPLVFSIAYFQGKEDFRTWSILGIGGALLKLLAAVGLVYVGWGVTGAIIALSASQLLVIYYINKKYKYIGTIDAYLKPKINVRVLKTYLSFSLYVFIVSLVFGILYSVDLVLIKHYLSPEEAGLYSGVATLGRIVVFATSPFIIVLLPSVNSRPAEKLQLLKKAIAYIVATGLACSVIFAFASKRIVGFVLGEGYVSSTIYLQRITLLFVMLAVLNALMYYQISMRDKKPVFVSLLGLSFLAVQIINEHKSIENILNSIIVSVLVMLLIMIILMSLLPRVRTLRRSI